MLEKKLVSLVLMLATIFMTTSCLKNEEDPLEVIGDVYVITQLVDGQVKHAAYYYAYSNKPISSANVTLPGGETVELEPLISGLTFANRTDSMDYSIYYPEEGNYQFNVTPKNGESVQDNDVLEIVSFDIPTFYQVEYTGSIFGYELDWDLVDGAEAYLIRIADDEGTLIFRSFLLNENADNYELANNIGGYWETNAIKGETYSLELLAYIFDEKPGGEISTQEIQQIALSRTEFVWGE